MDTSKEIEAGFDEIEQRFKAETYVEVLVLTDRLLGLVPPPLIVAALHRRRARAYAFLEMWEQAALEWTKVLTQIPQDPEACEGASRRWNVERPSSGRCAAWPSSLAAIPCGASCTSDSHPWTLCDYSCRRKDKNGRNVDCGTGKENPFCKQAEEMCNTAIRLNPDNPMAYCARAGVHQCRRNRDAALADCRCAIELDSRCAVAYSLRASIRNSEDELEEAIADWTRVIELNPSDGIAHTLRGFAYDELGEADKAAADHLRAFELENTKHRG